MTMSGQSYEDHSKVLMGDRYQKYTKNLSPDDYKGWAAGIKAGGYATSKNYVNTIVSVIEGTNLSEVRPDGHAGDASSR